MTYGAAFQVRGQFPGQTSPGAAMVSRAGVSGCRYGFQGRSGFQVQVRLRVQAFPGAVVDAVRRPSLLKYIPKMHALRRTLFVILLFASHIAIGKKD